MDPLRTPQAQALIAAVRQKSAAVNDGNPTTRFDFDYRDRAPIFVFLQSFDEKGISTADVGERTASELYPGWLVAEDIHAQFVDSVVAPPMPAASGEWTEDADAILGNTFSCGGQSLTLADPISWDRSPTSTHWMYLLSRFGCLRTLAQAFTATGDQRYADKGIALIIGWLDAGDICLAFPPGTCEPDEYSSFFASPYVWNSMLEVGFRLSAWGQALSTFLPLVPDCCSRDQLLRILKSVHDQLHLLDFIIPEGGHGNGLCSGSAAMLTALTYFPSVQGAADLANRAMARVETTLECQVLPDGMQHELSVHYHSCVIRDLLDICRDAPLLGMQPSEGPRAGGSSRTVPCQRPGRARLRPPSHPHA